MKPELVRSVGVWGFELRRGDRVAIAEVVGELEACGYQMVWAPDVGDEPTGSILQALDRLLDVSTTIGVASGILNVWHTEALEVVTWWAAQPYERRRRLVVGLGISHRPLIGDRYRAPLDTMRSYLDDLDAAGMPSAARVLAALGPRMLRLGAERAAGAHTYLCPPEHTASARAALGPGAALVAAQSVVMETDPDTARSIARKVLAAYAAMPNYARNWYRLGYDEDEVRALGDRLVDAVVAWGDVEDVAERVRAHFDAGASHVCINVVSPRGAPLPLDAWRRLAPALSEVARASG